MKRITIKIHRDPLMPKATKKPKKDAVKPKKRVKVKAKVKAKKAKRKGGRRC